MDKMDYALPAALSLLLVIVVAMAVFYSMLSDRMPASQRKLAYLVGMFILFFFVIYLGLPAPPPVADASGNAAPSLGGGVLAQKRVEYDLGETSLGNVDPASSTMNLVLLGMRGIASSSLWQQANEQQKNKDWANYRATLDSILLLQPYYVKVWNFQAWNLSYNVAAEWDGVADRYYWLKEGIKFMQKGIKRNKKHPELYWYEGSFLGEKIGTADESRQYRAYFRGLPGYEDPEPDPEDPEPDFRLRAKRWKKGYDEELNRDGEDHYLVARTWFEQANARELAAQQEYGVGQFEHINAFHIFFSYPWRSEIGYGQALLKEGVFGEVTQRAWAQALKGWTEKYGQFEWDTYAGRIHFEISDPEHKELLAEARKATDQRSTKLHWIDQMGNVVNYTYWRSRCKLESENNVDLLVPSNVEPGDEFSVTIRGATISHKAKSADPAEVVRGLAEAWGTAKTPEGKASPEFDAIRTQVVEESVAGAAAVPALKLTWSSVSVEHAPVTAAKNGGDKDDQQLARIVRSRAIVDAHKDLYDGERLLFSADYVTAEQVLTNGLSKFQETLRQYPNFLHDTDLTESLMVAILEWRQTRELLEEELQDGDDHPLMEVWKVLRDHNEPAIQKELDALTTAVGRDNYLIAEQQFMRTRSPLVLVLTINRDRMSQIVEEKERRLKNFKSDVKVKK